MGKPFEKELEKVLDTLDWGMQQSAKELKEEIINISRKPLFVVGSGGSLSACYYAVLLYQKYGMMAKAITPLELYYCKHTLRESNILFISASGKNTDVLFGFKTALSFEPNRIFSLCMKKDSPLSKLSSETSLGKSFEFNIPTGKDGFLATNSLIAFFAVLFKCFSDVPVPAIQEFRMGNSYLSELDLFMEKITPEFTFTVLYAGWGQPVAVDIESKLAEAALANILLSDYRNFGHGRHHWFDKRKKNAAIIALISPEEEKIAEKTLSLLPADIPVLKIKSEFANELASIDLLIRSFYFINELGKVQNIDPGKPGVPDFGSRLYHLKYQNFYKNKDDNISENEKIAVIRKANVPSYAHLCSSDKTYWSTAYKKFMNGLIKSTYGIIIFDYDGTLCSAENRWKGIDSNISKAIVEILDKGIIVGIATGRGKSVRTDIQKAIPDKKYWNQIIIGYYNGSDVGLLSDNESPNKNSEINPSLQQIYNELIEYNFPAKVLPEIKPNQLTINIEDKNDWNKVRMSIIQLVMVKSIPNVHILESSHSMDIIDHSVTSKLNIINFCQKLASQSGLALDYLCIGDKGQWPGNDYILLASKFSLSVDEVSPINTSCWNLAAPGIKNIKATLYYLSCVTFNSKGFTLNFK